MSNPLVSVNMVVHNGEKFIAEAIQSILNQTYSNFELIIVNDASTDSTEKIIKSFSDTRIFYYEHSNNSGECISRNTALKKSKGKYIAINDSDDNSFPLRLVKQVKFLEENLDYGLVGSLAEVIDKDGITKGNIQSLAFSCKMTKVFLLFRNCFTHSSFMYRKKDLLKVGINKNKPIAVDYETAVKISRISKICNIDEALVQYREHGNNMLVKYKNDIESNVKAILKMQIEELGINPTKQELDIHYRFKKSLSHHVNKKFLAHILWLDKLYFANKKQMVFPNDEFSRYVAGYWFNLINNPDQYNIKLLQPYFKSPILRSSNRKLIDHLKFIIKCLFKYKPRNL